MNITRSIIALFAVASIATAQNPSSPYTMINRIKPISGQTVVTIETPLEFQGFASDPASPRNGQVWYNSTGNALKARINGATVSLGAGGGGGGGDALTTSPLSQFAATTSSQLRGVISDETGSGALVFAGGNVGAATATSLNGLTLTTSTGTLTIANGKTLNVQRTLTLTGTDSTTHTFPGTSSALARTDAGQFFSGTQAFLSAVHLGGESVVGELRFFAGDAAGAIWTDVAPTATATRLINLPDADGTLALLTFDQTWQSLQTFSNTMLGVRNAADTFTTRFSSTATADRTITLPNATDTLIGRATTDTLTNKTINGSSNTLTVRLANDVSGTLPISNGGTGLSALGTAGQVLRVNAGATALEYGTASGSNVTAIHSATGVTIGNTVTETAIVSRQIDANSLGTTGIIRFRICGNVLQNSGTQTGTLKVKLGATTLYNGVTPAFSANATRRGLVIEGTIHNQGATNSQRLTGSLFIGNPTAPTTGIGSFATTMPISGIFGGTSTVDTTANQTLEVTWTHSVANASVEIVADAVVERINP